MTTTAEFPGRRGDLIAQWGVSSPASGTDFCAALSALTDAMLQ